MSLQRLIGIALIVGGVILFVMGLNATDSFADRWSNFFTGHFTDHTVWMMVGGVVAFLVGVSLASIGGRRSEA